MWYLNNRRGTVLNGSSDIPGGLLKTDVVQYLMTAVIYQVVS